MASKLFIQIKRYRTECSLSQILQSMTTFNKVTFSSDHGTTEFRAGDCVSLSCDGAQGVCSDIAWLFSHNHQAAVELVVNGQVKSDIDKSSGRLHFTNKCSLEVKTTGKEDEGSYTCRQHPSSGPMVDHEQYDLKQMSKYLYVFK